MRSKTLQLVLAALALATSPGLASTPASLPTGSIDPNSPASITFEVKVRVEEIAEQSTLVLVDLATEQRHVIRLDDSIKIRARSKKAFDGRRKLGFADLRAGQLLKITASVHDGEIHKITVLKAA